MLKLKVYTQAYKLKPLHVSNSNDPLSNCNAVDTPKNIILVGFMGCGKSTIGREISKMLNYQLLDTDELIEKNTQNKISEIFSQYGELAFRNLESELLTKMVESKIEKKVISTGGGLPLREENQTQLKNLGYVVWLNASVETILNRTGHTAHRPLLECDDPREVVTTMLSQRNDIYQSCSHIKVSTDDLAVADTAHGIIESARYYFCKQ